MLLRSLPHPDVLTCRAASGFALLGRSRRNPSELTTYERSLMPLKSTNSLVDVVPGALDSDPKCACPWLCDLPSAPPLQRTSTATRVTPASSAKVTAVSSSENEKVE